MKTLIAAFTFLTVVAAAPSGPIGSAIISGPAGVVTNDGPIGPTSNRLNLSSWNFKNDKDAERFLHDFVRDEPNHGVVGNGSNNARVVTNGGGVIRASAHGATITGPGAYPADNTWEPTNNVGIRRHGQRH